MFLLHIYNLIIDVKTIQSLTKKQFKCMVIGTRK